MVTRRLAGVTAAFGATEDEAVANLAEGIERFGADLPFIPLPPPREAPPPMLSRRTKELAAYPLVSH